MKKLRTILVAFMVMFAGVSLLVGCDLGKDKTYSITIAETENGIISVSKSQAKEGEEISVTATAESGYELAIITINGEKLTTSTFKMPNKDVKIDALFNKSSGQSEGVDLIQYKLGCYNCVSSVNVTDGYLIISDLFNTITIKENNQASFFGRIYGQMVEIDNILFARNGNMISATAGTFEAQINIIDEETLTMKDGRYLHTFVYHEQVELEQGDYYCHKFLEQGLEYIDFSIKADNKIEIGYSDEDYLYTQRFIGQYQILGNEFVLPIGDEIFVAKLQTSSNKNNPYNLMNLNKITTNEEGDVVFTEIDDWLNVWSGYSLEVGSYAYHGISGSGAPTFVDSDYSITIYDDNTLDFSGNLYRDEIPGKIFVQKASFERVGDLLIVDLEDYQTTLKIEISNYLCIALGEDFEILMSKV